VSAPAQTPSVLGPALAVLALALTVRLLHVFQMRAAPLFTVLMGDSRGYDDWARRLAGGDWIGTEVFYQAPLYPYFLGVIYAIAGPDPFVVRIVQAVIGALSCVALAYAGWRLFSRPVGIAAGVVLALYPTAIFFDALIQKSVLDLFFTSLSLAVIAAIAAGTERWRAAWFLLGLCVAALSLARENALLLAALVIVWALIRRALAPTLLVIAGMAVLFVPVAARNAAVGGGFYLTTSQFGSNFFIGNNPRSDGTYMSLRPGRGAPEFERQDATELAQEAVGRRLTPGEVSDYWFDHSRAYIQSEPRAWLRLMARKAALLVNGSEMLDTESQESHAEHSAVLALTSLVGHFGLLVPLALFGAIVAWPRRSELWIVYAALALYAASVVAFFVMARYRHPMLPFLVLFAAAGIAGAVQFVKDASRRRVAVALVMVGVAAIITNREMLSSPLMQAITEHNLATALQEEGRTDEAIAHYQRALSIRPDYAPAYNNLGTALMAKGEHAAAVAAFRQSLRLQPQSASARQLLADATYDLGSALIERGAFAQAEAPLREAIELDPRYAEAHNNLGIVLASTGRLAEAVAHWERALEIRPGFVDAQRNLALAQQRSDDIGAAGTATLGHEKIAGMRCAATPRPTARENSRVGGGNADPMFQIPRILNGGLRYASSASSVAFCASRVTRSPKFANRGSSVCPRLYRTKIC
jgi:tetratricopeptide (TPR) repeat protein